MNQSVIKINSGLLAGLAHGGLTVSVAPRDILVLQCIVAGTSFRKLQESDEHLQTDTKLTAKREAKNKHDDFAVSLWLNEVKTGYIPRDKNEVIARLMDAGKQFFATIREKEWEGNWLRLEVDVFMKD